MAQFYLSPVAQFYLSLDNPPAVGARTARDPLLRPGDSKRERMREPHQAANRETLCMPMGGADAKLRPG